MVRVEDLNITFFHVAKNAGSSIARWLEDNVNGDQYHEDLRHGSPDRLRSLFDDYGWKFCCVRNPWDRIVSWYEFFNKQGRVNCNFSTFLERSYKQKANNAKVFKPLDNQINFTKHCDYVMRYENLEEDFKVVQQKVNCFEPLKTFNASDRSLKTYVDYYTDTRYIDIVRTKHREEIEQLGYEFGGQYETRKRSK